MSRACLISIAFILMATGVCHPADQIEIVLDMSAEMWRPFPAGIPKFVAVRSTLDSLILSPIVRDLELEIGLRMLGGRRELIEALGCTDTEAAIDRGPVDVTVWSSTLAELDPRGRRPLAHAIEVAAEDISSHGESGRIILITSGNDQCQRDIGLLLGKLSTIDPKVAVRVVGLDLGHELASALAPLCPIRNVTDPAKLIETLQWAVLPDGADSTRTEWLELRVTRDDEPLSGATIHFSEPFKEDVFTAEIEEGATRARLAPGRYWAAVEGAATEPIQLAEIVHSGRETPLDVPLVVTPQVTLEVVPERPSEGSDTYVQFWGAPPGRNWVAIAPSEAPPGEYVGRASAAGSSGEVMLTLPDSSYELEVSFIHELESGVQQILGRLEFEAGRRRMALDTPTRAENGTQLEIGWSGEELEGDFVAIAAKGDDLTESVSCSPATDGGPLSFMAPTVAGDYVIRYLSRRGRIVASVDLEIFEILATLAGPAEVAPGESFAVAWTGPDENQDFLSIAAVGEGDDQYRSFSPAAAGSPARLRAPREPGDYELRYVRANDGEVLARKQFVVKAVGIVLEVPSFAEVGTRFEVAWSGTPEAGDFIAVARPRWGPKRHLDWSFIDLGSPVSLAAPFEAGLYEVRCISGASGRIIDRAEIEVR